MKRFAGLEKRLAAHHYLASLEDIVRRQRRCGFFYAGKNEREALGYLKLLQSAGLAAKVLVLLEPLELSLPAGSEAVLLSDMQRAKPAVDVILAERGSWTMAFAQFFARLGIRTLYFMDGYAAKARYEAIAAHLPELRRVYGALADEEARVSFCATLEGYVSAEVSRYRYAAGTQYMLEGFRPEAGETVIDGGAYDGADAKMFASLGADVHAFELDAANYVLCAAAARQYGFQASSCGLWSKEANARYIEGGAASHIHARGTASAGLTTLDAYAHGQGLLRIDCIKLNIEGAELAALEGAAGVIRRDKPKLALAVSHRTEHLWQIASYVKSLYPDYAFSFRHYRTDVRERLGKREKELLRRLGIEPLVPGDWGMVLYCR